jgi:hypothetical protein
MALWPTTAIIAGPDLKLLVTNALGEDLIKARLPRRPPHPRALVTLLEGVALWSGEPLGVVISAADPRDDWFGSEAWHEAVWPNESPLVRLDFEIRQDFDRVFLIIRGSDGTFVEARDVTPTATGG